MIVTTCIDIFIVFVYPLTWIADTNCFKRCVRRLSRAGRRATTDLLDAYDRSFSYMRWIQGATRFYGLGSLVGFILSVTMLAASETSILKTRLEAPYYALWAVLVLTAAMRSTAALRLEASLARLGDRAANQSDEKQSDRIFEHIKASMDLKQ